MVNALAEIEDVIRTMPPRDQFRHHNDEVLVWLGRAVAAISNWDSAKGIFAGTAVSNLHAGPATTTCKSSIALVILLNEARSALRLKTLGPTNIAIGQGLVFNYFDELRKPISLAKSDLLFVDPYLDADFVSRYLPSVSPGVQIRLLARELISTLVPAARLFANQYKASVEIRSANKFHDRLMIIDRQMCYQSGASFKDGGRTSPTTISQIVHAFPAVLQTYEDIWSRAAIV